MAWERFRNRRRGGTRQFPGKMEGTFQTEVSNGSRIYILYLDKGLAAELGRRVCLWFDPSRRWLGLSQASPGDLDAYRVGPTTHNVSLSGIARKYGFHHVFDGRTLESEREGDMHVFDVSD